MLRHLPVADGLHRRLVLFEAALEQIAGLIHQPAPEHFVHTDVDARVQIPRLPRKAMNGRDGALRRPVIAAR
jgi:hypothetical protein